MTRREIFRKTTKVRSRESISKTSVNSLKTVAPPDRVRYLYCAMFHRRSFVLLATVILLTAAGLRLSDLHNYPPGPHYDEAVYFIVSRNIAFAGARFFPMVEAYQGREVLYMYLNAPFLQLIHDDIFTLHMVSAFCNLITVAATIALGRLMFRGRRGWIIGLTLGALIALNFPQIWLARQAFRAVTLPFMQAIALAFLWRGLTVKRRDWLWLLIGGFLAGATVYTYNSSRLFPLWLGLAGIALLIFDRARWRLRLRQGVIFFGMLIVVAAPMALYAVQRPDVFFGRLAEVTQADQSVSLGESILLHAKMFFIDGDPYLRYNIPHRPYFTLPEGLLLLIGIGVACVRLLRRGDPLERTAYALAILSPLMIIPSVISVGGLPPSHMRSLGMIPLIFVLVAVGFEWVYSLVVHFWGTRSIATPPRPWERGLGGEVAFKAFVPLLLTTLMLGGLLVGQTYFTWASRADVYYATDADLSAAAQWLVAHHTDEIVYIAAQDKGHPTAMIEPLPPVTWLGTDLLFRPPLGQTGLYIFPRSAPPPDSWRAWLEPGAIADLPLGPDGRTAFEAFRIRGELPLPTVIPAHAENPYLRLIGMDAPSIESGTSGEIQLQWEVITPPPVGDYTPLVQLEDAQGNLLSRSEPYMTLTNEWRPGETLIQRVPISVPAATPPGEYPIRVAWVGRSSNEYSTYTGSGLWTEVGVISVLRTSVFNEINDILIKHSFTISGDLSILGYNLSNYIYRPGESIPVTLYWASSMQGLHAVNVTAELDNRRLDEWMPFAGYEWAAGETLAERRRFVIPQDTPAGEYSLTLNGELIATLTIAGIPRVFDIPTVATPVNAVFGDQLELIGYTSHRDGDILFIEINWYSVDVIQDSYKFFIHVLDNSGMIQSQIDTIPLENTYPTNLWAEGEVVTERYQLTLTPASRTIRLGVYDPDTGQRLSMDVNGSVDYFEFPID